MIRIAFLLGTISLALGCTSAPPELTGYAVNTPETYSENKVFFTHTPTPGLAAPPKMLDLLHLYEIGRHDSDAGLDLDIRHNDPLSVVLQGVRLPEDLGDGTRDIAVVLDLNTSNEKGLTTLLAFYQRDVPSGQMLNFNNLLVFADPMWDSANPPYFRVRVLDVKAERNRRTAAIFDRVGNLSSQIGGMIPHPAVPIVTTAIDAAGLILSNQENSVILDYQIQFYGQNQRQSAGNATLGALRAGQWLVIGRERGRDSSFWSDDLTLDRETDRLMRTAPDQDSEPHNVSVPYVSVAIVRADAEVPKLVLDRSESLLALLSTPGAKSDVDALDQLMTNLASSVSAFSVERRLRKYRSASDIEGIIQRLREHQAAIENGQDGLNIYELRRLTHVLDAVTDLGLSTVDQWVLWGDGLTPDALEHYRFVNDPEAPFGFYFRSITPD